MQCSNTAAPDSILCNSCGAQLPERRREAAETNALAKLALMNTMLAVVEEAASHLVGIMRHGDKDSDRLKAIDRVLDLAGVRTDKPLVEINISHGLRPQEDSRDARLAAIIGKIDSERAELLRARAIEAVSRDVSA